MNTSEVRAVLDRQVAALRGILPEPERWRLILVLAASEVLGERKHNDDRQEAKAIAWRH